MKGFAQKAVFSAALFLLACLPLSCAPRQQYTEGMKGLQGPVEAPAAAELPTEEPRASEETAQTAPPAPSAQPTPTPPPDPQAFADALLDTSILPYIPADTFVPEEGVKGYETIVSRPDIAYALPGKYAEWLKSAASSRFSPQVKSVSTTIRAPSWQMLSTLAYSHSGDRPAFSAALKAACDIRVEIKPAQEGYTAVISAAPKNPSDVFYSLTGELSPFINTLSYAYLTTIYDDDMNVRDGIGTPELPPLLFPLPDPEGYYFDDTWYADRDGGARRHTGTDINAPEGTDLLACADGFIRDAGTSEASGNFIVVQGADGTQYHYYHMVEPSALAAGARVSAGDVVGHVGNTGNSTANHLHFTIVTADGHYLNPYSYLREAAAG